LSCGEEIGEEDEDEDEEEEEDGVEMELERSVVDKFGKDFAREESKIEVRREGEDVEEEEERREGSDESGFVMGMPRREDSNERTLIIVVLS